MGKVDKDILAKIQEIVNELGDIKNEYMNYFQKTYTINYTLDNLSINCTESGDVDVLLDGIKVFSYSKQLKMISYVDGKWTELIDAVYERMPALAVMKMNRKINKSDALRVIDSSFKTYRDYIKNGNINVINYINSNLAANNICVVKNMNLLIDEKMVPNIGGRIPNSYYTIYFENKPVAELPYTLANKEYYYSKFIPGKWIRIFHEIICNAMEAETNLTKNGIDEESKKEIQKLMRLDPPNNK